MEGHFGYVYQIHRYDRTGHHKQTLPTLPPGEEDNGIVTVTADNHQYLAMSTGTCNRPKIRLVNLESGKCIQSNIVVLMPNIDREMKALNLSDGSVALFHMSGNSISINNTINIQEMSGTKNVCYIKSHEHGGLLIYSTGNHYFNGGLKAMSTHTNQTVWSLQGRVAKCLFNPRGICTDNKGLLYVADGHNSRILVIYGNTGKVLQVLQPTELKGQVIRNLAWCKVPSQLIVQHDYTKMTYFAVHC